ncbi:MAG TPA: hypothetical protein EYN93_06940 [Planctomycetaceae bacterium]|nr:hypothetical protein [Planctomycetaceae bacterium]
MEQLARGPRLTRREVGSEPTSKILFSGREAQGVMLHFSPSGKPMPCAVGSRFNGKFRDNCLQQNRSMDFPWALQIIGDWRA